MLDMSLPWGCHASSCETKRHSNCMGMCCGFVKRPEFLDNIQSNDMAMVPRNVHVVTIVPPVTISYRECQHNSLAPQLRRSLGPDIVFVGTANCVPELVVTGNSPYVTYNHQARAMHIKVIYNWHRLPTVTVAATITASIASVATTERSASATYNTVH